MDIGEALRHNEWPRWTKWDNDEHEGNESESASWHVGQITSEWVALGELNKSGEINMTPGGKGKAGGEGKGKSLSNDFVNRVVEATKAKG